MSSDPSGTVTPDTAHLDRVLVSAFLENFPDFVYFKDRDGRFLAVSKSKLHRNGLADPAEIVGKTDFDFFHAKHAQHAKHNEDEVMRTGAPILNQAERLTWSDGRQSWALSSKLPLRGDDGEIVGTFGITKDVTESKQTELALEKTHRALVDASRLAGMAEVATSVLHNVGNVLNSLNVSATVVANGLRQSKADSLARLSALLKEHETDLVPFLTTDPKGSRVPELLSALARHAVEERDRLLTELIALQKNVDHIKEIVAMQQAYATMRGTVEPLDPAGVMEDALRMNAAALVRHSVRAVRFFDFVPPILAEKAKVLQVLVNLIRNAKYAADDGPAEDKVVTVRVAEGAPGFVRLVVEDNGVGIAAENLTKIFQHGFTTRKEGHGFGLHSSANAAREMKGTLTVHSDGPGHGATFTLELPAAPPAIPLDS